MLSYSNSILTGMYFEQKSKNNENKLILINSINRYLSDLTLKADKKPEKVLGVAIFGLGRAGTIHMSNIANSQRVKILYIVEDMESKWNAIKNYWKLDAKIITSKQSNQVYSDPKYV